MQDDMLIVEDLMLLLLDDTSGAIAGAGTLHYTLSGAVLTELALNGWVDIDEDQKGLKTGIYGPTVHAKPDVTIADPLLRAAYETVARKPERVQTLLIDIGTGSDLRGAVLDRLLERGLIREEKKKFLGLIPTTRLPIDDGRHEEELRQKVVDVLEDGQDPDSHTAAVIALLSSSGVLPSLHPRPRWSGDVHRRGKELEQGSWGPAAVNTAVVRTAAAIAASSVAVTIAVTNS